MDALLAITFLFAAGAPAAFAVTRRVALTVILAPLLSALLCTMAGLIMVAIGGSLSGWIMVLFVVEVALAWWLLGRPRHPRDLRSGCAPRRASPGLPPVGGGDVVVMFVPLLVPGLLALNPPVDWDARSIWWFHASWFWTGASGLREALGNPAFAFSHGDYPPLVPATVAGVWHASSSTSLRIAQVVSTILTLAAIALLVYAVRQLAPAGLGVPARLAGLAVGLSAWMLASGGPGAGYVDHLWAASLAGAAVFLLIDPDTSGRSPSEAPALEVPHGHGVVAVKVTIAVVLATIAALTKNEGLVAVILLAGLFTVRVRHNLRLAAAAWIPVLAGLTWVVLANAHGAVSDLGKSHRVTQLKAFDLTPFERVLPTLTAIRGLLGPYLVASAVVTMVGTILLRRARRRTGMASTAWIWTTVGLYTMTVVGTYVISPYELSWHLSTSLERVSVVIVLLLAANTASWFLTALSRPGHRPAHEDASAQGADAELADDGALLPDGSLATRSPSVPGR